MSKALNRLIYTISNGNKPNQTDIDALNNVISYYNKERERSIENQEMFAKVFIGTFKDLIIKSNGDYKGSLNTLKKYLAIDMQPHYDSFHTDLNQLEFKMYCDYIGIVEEKTLKDIGFNKELIQDNTKTLTKLLDHYTKEKVYNRLNTLMAGLINDYEDDKKFWSKYVNKFNK